MKNRLIMGVVYITAGLLTAVGPHTIFKVCDPSKMVMKCHWAASAEIGVGIITVAAGILYLLMEQKQAKVTISLLGLVTGVVAILITTVLIGGCEDPAEPCRLYSFPVLNTISALSIVASAGNLLHIVKRNELRK